MKRSVIVTGGCGFIGRAVVELLLRKGYSPKVIDNLTAPGSRGIAEPECELVDADLRDRKATLDAFEHAGTCIALAARSAGIGFFNKHPAEMLDDNARIVSNTFEAVRAHRIDKILYVSSSCVFDASPAQPITETAVDSSPPPPPGYPFSKYLGEAYCKAYYRQYQLCYVIVRPFNVYGPGELPGKIPGDSHVIPDLAAKILGGQYPLQIFGDGLQTRSFTHVDDIARGIMLAVETPSANGQDFNLGHPRETSINELAHVLWRICDRTEPFAVDHLRACEPDVRRRSVDPSRAGSILGWQPAVELEQGLEQVVAWMRECDSTGRANLAQ